MSTPAQTHRVTVIVTRTTLGVLAAAVAVGEVIVVIWSTALAELYPEFAYLQVPFVVAAIACGACVETALIITDVLAGYTRDHRLFEPAAIRLVTGLISTIAAATVIVAAVLTAIPGPPVLALLLFGSAAAGAAGVLALVWLRSRLRGAAPGRVKPGEASEVGITAGNVAMLTNRRTHAAKPWWGISWSGDTWLGVAFALWILSLMSGFIALISGFNFDPDDYSSEYYAARIPQVVTVMVVSVLIPAASAVASVLSILATPRRPGRTAYGTIVLLLAMSGVDVCWVIGIEAIQQTIQFAEHSPM